MNTAHNILGLTKKSNYMKIILSTEFVKGVKVGKMDFLVSPMISYPDL
jgi:hypothetical protein